MCENYEYSYKKCLRNKIKALFSSKIVQFYSAKLNVGLSEKELSKAGNTMVRKRPHNL